MRIVAVKLIDSDSAESEEECEDNKEASKLVDANCSDESKTMQKKSAFNIQEKMKNKSTGATRKKRTLSEGLQDVPAKEEQMDVSKINTFLKEASEALLADCGYKAVQIFRGPLRHFIESSQFLSFEECDIVCIKYSYGIAYCKSGGYDDLQKCITILKGIIKDHDSITFPAAHYSLGLAYRKLNRFKDALNNLEIVQNFLHKGIHFKVYPWPGMTTVIQETKPDILKTLVHDLIKECESPPNPDAYCRYNNCEYQPSIYYTDPDFKGYVSLYCSEQCCMQYHFLCWKEMKMEQDLTDKDFLEKFCFTPDCDGVIVKIQNIDKKGDLSKEFTSDFKKQSKQKWAKWGKRIEFKEKKQKKGNGKCDEMSNGNERRDSCNADDESPSPQLSGSYDSVEETNKLDSLENASKIKEETEFSTDLQNNIDSSHENLPQTPISSPVIEDTKEVNDDAKQIKENGPRSYLDECIKNNVYSFMNDFLQHHGPLKVDDPVLTDEIESFPEEVHAIIAKYGGIGEFLKDDLRFAYVGDMYVCVVADLASAYKMCNSACLLPTDFKNLPSLEGAEDSESYNKCNSETLSQNTSLNPDAVEYTPFSINNNSHYKFTSNNTHSQKLNSDSPSFVPAAFKPSSKYDMSVYQNSGTSLSTSTETERYPETSKYCDNTGSEKVPECTYQSRQSSAPLISDSFIEGSNSVNKMSIKGSNIVLENSHDTAKIEFNLLLKFLKFYCSDGMNSHRHKIDSYIKPFVIKRQPELAASGTMTDTNLAGGDLSKVDMLALSEQNSLINKMLEKSKQNQQQLNAEIAQLQRKLKELEDVKKEYKQKEEEMLDGRKYLLESLTKAHESIDKHKQKLAALTEEKNSLQKTVDNLTLSLKKSEDKLKSTIDSKEKHFKDIISSLQNERDELKNRAKCSELQVLQLKKTEYLRKIDEKSSEAAKRRKELQDGLSMVGHLNPMLQSDMKALSTQLVAYVNNLSGLRLDFMKKIDSEIEKVKNGTPLKDIKELEMKELPDIPSWKTSVPANGPTLDKQTVNPVNPLFNFGTNMAASRPFPTATFESPLTPDASVVPSTKAPSATVAPLIAPMAVAGVPPAVSVPLNSNKSTKTEASNGDFSVNFNTGSLEDSFKKAMASINAFASTPYDLPSLDNEFQKKCDVFKHPGPVPTNKVEISKVPPGIKNPLLPTPEKVVSKNLIPGIKTPLLPTPENVVSKNLIPGIKTPLLPTPEKVVSKNLIPEPQPVCSNAKKQLDTLDTVPVVKPETAQSTWDLEKKKTARNSYEKLLNKLKEHFPQYNQEELISFVKEFRSQRQGKLSGLPMDTIISEISKLIMEKKMAEKKVSEAKVQPKSAKVLVNKKLVSDSKPPPSTSEQQNVKKKTAWDTIDSESRRNFSGSVEDDCSICYDPMTRVTAYKVSCGHTFHERCIRNWLETQHTCPICRILLLLPEEYPSLS